MQSQLPILKIEAKRKRSLSNRFTIQAYTVMGAAGIICTSMLVAFSIACFAVTAGGQPVFDVMRYGARGDGTIDDTQAFKAAWAAACGAKAPATSMLVPASRTFLVGSVEFNGPCTSQNITVQVTGTIVAPPASKWSGGGADHWLLFNRVDRLTVTGNGVLDGNGQSWWARKCEDINCLNSAPTALKLQDCNNQELSGFTSKNSPQVHIRLFRSRSIKVERLTITAPSDSPNTDGINIGQCSDVHIADSNIGTGDDCVSIVSGCRFITVQGITCGPGHGVSVGSLGKNGQNAAVENIEVSHVKFINTQNGARIKTWQGGAGYAKSISFTDIEFTNVSNPVIINQFYTDRGMNGPLAITNITYTNLRGTSRQPTAVIFRCAVPGSCTSIHVNNMNITGQGGSETVALCQNAQGDASGYVHPVIPCLKS